MARCLEELWEGVEGFDEEMDHIFKLFGKAASKGHQEAIWIVKVVKDVEMNVISLQEAFGETEDALGWFFAGLLSHEEGMERFDYYEMSAEAGCSWGQVGYGQYYESGGEYVERDEKVHMEWMEKAAKQNNPHAMYLLGYWFGPSASWMGEGGNDEEKSAIYYGAAAELGWKIAMYWWSYALKKGQGCAKNYRKAVIWSARGRSEVFWDILEETGHAFQKETTDGDFDRLCYTLGWGLYWYRHGTGHSYDKHLREMCDGCLDYYCEAVELQQESIFTFLIFWNQTTGGIKAPGQMIAKMVWEKREENLVKEFGNKKK
jgi:hypothetical protein